MKKLIEISKKSREIIRDPSRAPAVAPQILRLAEDAIEMVLAHNKKPQVQPKNYAKVDPDIGKRIAQCRRHFHLTQSDLASALVISKGQICNFERGRSVPSAPQFRKMAQFMKISVEGLHAPPGSPVPRRPGRRKTPNTQKGPHVQQR